MPRSTPPSTPHSTPLTLPRGFLTIGLTPGCPAGVGPEVWAKALSVVDETLPQTVRLRWFASAALLLEGARRAGVAAHREHGARNDEDHVVIDSADGAGSRKIEIAVKDADDRGRHSQPRVVDDDALACQRDALLRACVAAARGDVHGIVTGPVRKAALVVDGVGFPGQTELVHKYLHDDRAPEGGGPPLMVFAGAPFVMGLFTVHVALSAVPGLVQPAPLERAIRQLAAAARSLLDVERPRIVVLGVNPHAGEGGLFGDEELRVVSPVIERLKRAAAAGDVAFDVDGPVPADGFFADVARHKKGLTTLRGVHGVLAMHHDQGLSPYKLLVGGEGINITWGLRVPRTSPDHGTADAIAGTGVADPGSTLAALKTAVRLAQRAGR